MNPITPEVQAAIERVEMDLSVKCADTIRNAVEQLAAEVERLKKELQYEKDASIRFDILRNKITAFNNADIPK